MMRCTCGQLTLILDTRAEEKENMLRRRRMCPVCGTRFSNMEIMIEGTMKKMAVKQPLPKQVFKPRSRRIIVTRETIKKNADARRKLEIIKDSKMADGYDY